MLVGFKHLCVCAWLCVWLWLGTVQQQQQPPQHNNNNTPLGAGHRVVVEGLSSQSVRPLRGLTGEARSRPGVTVAGGPTVQSDTTVIITSV